MGHVTSTVLVGGNLTMDSVYRSAVHVAVVANFHDCLAGVEKTTRPLCVQDINTIIQSLDLDPVPESVLVAEGFDVVSSERLEDFLGPLEVLSGQEPRQLAALRGAARILLRLDWEDLEEESSDIAELRDRIRSGFPSMREVAVQQLANLASYLFEIRVFDGDSCVGLDERWADRFASLIAGEVPDA